MHRHMATDRRQRGRALWWVLGGLVALLVLVVGLVVGAGFWAVNLLKSELQATLQDAPAVQEHIGTIDSLSIDFGATAQAGRENYFILDVAGERGRGVVRAVFFTGMQEGALGGGELELEDGRILPLSGADADADADAQDEAAAMEAATERFLRNAADAIHAHPQIREHLGPVDDVQLDELASAAEPGRETFVFLLGGPLGRGVLTVEVSTVDAGTERLGRGVLVLEDGTEIALGE